jgi:hypothetical protein
VGRKFSGGGMKIKIKNWDEYNKRPDIKRPHWFAISNRLFELPNLCGADLEIVAVYLYLLCQASQQQQDGEVEIWADHAQRIGNINIKVLHKALNELTRRDFISRTDTFADVTHANENVRYITEQNNTEQNINTLFNSISSNRTPVRFSFKENDLLEIYNRYPRKQGKTVGFKRLRNALKSPQDVADFGVAVDRYRSHCESQQTDKKFIKLFSTFVSEWRDWLDPETGTTSGVKKKSVAEEWLAEQLAKEGAEGGGL